MEEEVTETSKGSCDKHEVYYKAKTLDEVTEIVAKTSARHTVDRPPFDKVTDSTDEVVLCARSKVPIVLLNSKSTE